MIIMVMPRLRILTVDDRPSITLVYRRLLEAAGYSVCVENDSTHALQAAHEFKPDLVLLDVHMPDIDGCEIAKQMSQDEELSSTPIAFVSGGAESTVTNRMGHADFLPKPFERESLLSFVRDHIKHAA